MKKYITLCSLTLGQGLSTTVISSLTLTSALVGKALAPTHFLATLPLTMTVLGSAIMVYVASVLMAQYGRKNAFILGSIIGICGAMLAIFAIYSSHFTLFLIASFLLGCATIFNQYYRFAAAEMADSPLWQKTATSLVISGGILGGIAGPYFAHLGTHFIPSRPFLGHFLFILVIFILLILSQFFVYLDKPTTQITREKNPLENSKIYSPNFLLGTLSCSVGFGLMTLIMNAAPLSMHNHAYPLAQNATVLQWHFVAMYLPSLLLPVLLKRIKTYWLILLGNSCFCIGAIVALFYDHYFGYLFVLIFAGIGWSLMFTGGTFYLNQLHAECKYPLQGKSTMITYLVNLGASFSVGLLLTLDQGWQLINSAVMLASLLFFLFYKRSANQLILR